MALPGLVADRNLADVIDREKAWDNLGNGVTDGVSTFVIKGADILALENVRDALTSSFVRIKGLTSTVQPRLTTAAAIVASGTLLRDNALLKASPTSVGNYFVTRGNVDAASLRINNLAAASISTTPFSGNTATAPLRIGSFLAPTNFRFTQAMPAGTLSNPSRAIPVENSLFVLYAKAGQS